jgi:hypothetical protein
MPVSLCNAFQNFDINSLSQLEMMSNGSPFLQYHFLKNISARWSEVSVEVEGVIWISEPGQLVKVMIVSKLLSRGSGLMKLIATESHQPSGIGKGWRGLIGSRGTQKKIVEYYVVFFY